MNVPVTGRGAEALQNVRVPDGGAAPAAAAQAAAASAVSAVTGRSRLCTYRSVDRSVAAFNPPAAGSASATAGGRARATGSNRHATGNEAAMSAGSVVSSST